MTFLEGLWSDLYSQSCAMQMAKYSAAGLDTGDLSAAQQQAIATEAAAFAAAMIAKSPGAKVAALQAIIAALK